MDDAEEEIVGIKSDVAEIKRSLNDGFKDMRTMLGQLTVERREWSTWLRETLTKSVKIIGIIVLFACGITQVGKLTSVLIENLCK